MQNDPKISNNYKALFVCPLSVSACVFFLCLFFSLHRLSTMSIRNMASHSWKKSLLRKPFLSLKILCTFSTNDREFQQMLNRDIMPLNIHFVWLW